MENTSLGARLLGGRERERETEGERGGGGVERGAVWCGAGYAGRKEGKREVVDRGRERGGR